MNCLNCQTETNNPKFCSKNCSAISTNKIPKRKAIERFCNKCEISLGTKTRKRRCPNCANTDFSKIFLKDIKGNGNANVKGRYPYIRSLSRKEYKKSKRPIKCFICKYSLHVDICHIKPIHTFSEETAISDINHISNLIALCKNHHWELDNGYLKLEAPMGFEPTWNPITLSKA